jgi:hypothetical protein
MSQPIIEHLISVDDEGRLTFIYSDDLLFLHELGRSSVTRASHVEPTSAGEWTADMNPSNGPVLGPFKTRKEALDAEIEWLKEN